jgi:hypothetical protein
MLALTAISIEDVVCLVIIEFSCILIVPLTKAFKDIRICRRDTGVVIVVTVWMVCWIGIVWLIPSGKPSIAPDAIYPFRRLIALLAMYASAGLGLTIITVFGFFVDIYRNRQNAVNSKKKHY